MCCKVQYHKVLLSACNTDTIACFICCILLASLDSNNMIEDKYGITDRAARSNLLQTVV